MTTFSRRGLHGSIVDALGLRIVSGEIAEGSIVDPDALERELEVSRTVVREAIKVLTTKGLVDAKPRLGTFVRPRSDWNLLDEDVMGWRGADGPDARLLRELDEVRQVVEPSGARIAAERRTEEDLIVLAEALRQMRAETSDISALTAADLAFHRAVLSATHNELLDRLEVLLAPAMHVRATLAFGQPHQREFLKAHQVVVDAIERSDGDAAHEAMAALLHEAASDTERILSKTRRRK